MIKICKLFLAVSAFALAVSGCSSKGSKAEELGWKLAVQS